MVMNKLYTLLIISLLLFSCNETEKKQKDNLETSENEIAVVENKDEVSNALPIVDYEGLKPYLEKEDDITYVVNFWATWCRPCVAELPYFEFITEKYNTQKVKVILVSQDMKSAVKSALIPFVKKRKLQSKVILLHDPDANGWINKIDPSWSGGFPATVIYNKKYQHFREGNF